MSEMNSQVMESLIKFISSISSSYNYINISFFGGEPFLVFDKVVARILSQAKLMLEEAGSQYSIGFTTNGTLIKEHQLLCLKDFPPSNFQITLDGDRLHHNKTRRSHLLPETYDLIMDSIAMLIDYGNHVTLRINYTDMNVDSLCEVADDLLGVVPFPQDLLHVRLHQVWQNTFVDLSRKVSEVIDYFTRKGISASKPIFINLKSPCYADYDNSCVINYHGSVFKCTAVNFLEASPQGHLTPDGSIAWTSNYLRRRATYKIKSGSCLRCRIRPICNGGCSQKVLQNDFKDYCLFGYDERSKDQVVLDIFSQKINQKLLNNFMTSK